MDSRGPLRVLVTGASYGLGRVIAEILRRRGDEVYTVSRTRPEESQDTWVMADQGDIEALPSVADRLSGLTAGPFSGVVLNAAIAERVARQWDVDQIERHFRVNALGPIALWEALVVRGLIADPCNVVLLGSYIQNGSARQPAYAMSKAALWSWMRSFTMNQPPHDPVSMTMVWPGRVATAGNPLRDLPADDPNFFYPPERVAHVIMGILDQAPGGPRGTVIDLGRS